MLYWYQNLYNLVCLDIGESGDSQMIMQGRMKASWSDKEVFYNLR